MTAAPSPSDNAPGRWLEQLLGRRPRDPARFAQALTHASHAGASYERPEFLGDRVLGLVMAEWLFELFPDEAEGKLARRLATLVSGATCAEIAEALDVAAQLRLGKQARDDGAARSENVLGDALEAIIGAVFLEGGYDEARGFVRRLWADRPRGQGAAPRHPKAALQEHAAAKGWKPPVYTLARRSGPEHAPTFAVMVEVPGRGSAEGAGASKQEAETAAAVALMERIAG